MKKAIVVLSGKLIKGDADRWRSAGLTDLDLAGGECSFLRVVAAASLWKEDPTLSIIVCGGRGTLDSVFPEGVTASSIVKRELVALDVSARAIEEETGSGNTYEQLANLTRYFPKLVKDLTIVTNEWHLPRVRAFIGTRENLELLRLPGIHFCAAEEVLLRDDKEWTVSIEELRHSKQMAELVEREERGVVCIRAETYVYSGQSTN